MIKKITCRKIWTNKILSLGGQLILFKSVLSTIPVYFLSFFKASSRIISSLDSILSKKKLGGGADVRKMSWIKWDTVSGENESLGVKRLKKFIISLLGKRVWRLLQERKSLWYKVLGVAYDDEGGRLCSMGEKGRCGGKI